MALVTGMHRCIADGIALARVLQSLTGEQPDLQVAPPVAEANGHGLRDLLVAPAHAGPHLAAPDCTRRCTSSRTRRRRSRASPPEGNADARALARLLLTSGDEKTVFTASWASLARSPGRTLSRSTASPRPARWGRRAHLQLRGRPDLQDLRRRDDGRARSRTGP
jgi:hypothetical protein